MEKLGIFGSKKGQPWRRSVIAAVVLGALGVATAATTAKDAQASVDPANCTFRMRDEFTYVAICYSSTSGDSWHLQLTCQRGPKTYTVDGSNAYTTAASWSYSLASCGPYQNAEVVSERVVNGP